MSSWVRRGLPRQFLLMKLKSLCSIWGEMRVVRLGGGVGADGAGRSPVHVARGVRRGYLDSVGCYVTVRGEAARATSKPSSWSWAMRRRA
jgi:hypothetical protein